ncbi:hypothetical protein [Polymorphospora lycopeni]|uniref:GIY-YIG domain-containing protein n=1 Tax=Polymorphospora lycopeni TaxID=3140240 RepID=A0ABV5CL54_9ACTN
MTASAFRRRAPRASASNAVGARWGCVYALITRHDLTGEIGVGYVGETTDLEARLAQHALQPFADRIVRVVLAGQGVWTEAHRKGLEKHYIRHGVTVPGVTGGRPQRPWFNVDHNRDNPNRILPWDAIRYRQAREPGWQPQIGWQRRLVTIPTVPQGPMPRRVVVWCWRQCKAAGGRAARWCWRSLLRWLRRKARRRR